MTTAEFLETKRRTGRTTKMINHVIIQSLRKPGRTFVIHVGTWQQKLDISVKVQERLGQEGIPFYKSSVYTLRVGNTGELGTVEFYSPEEDLDRPTRLKGYGDVVHVYDHYRTETSIKKQLNELARWEG